MQSLFPVVLKTHNYRLGEKNPATALITIISSTFHTRIVYGKRDGQEDKPLSYLITGYAAVKWLNNFIVTVRENKAGVMVQCEVFSGVTENGYALILLWAIVFSGHQ